MTRSAGFKTALLLALISIVPTILIWAPFFLGSEQVFGVPIPDGGMASIVQNYDGPLYILVAKTFYNAEAIKAMFSFNLPVEYYAAHFPLYPLLIRLTALVIRSYPYAMLFVTMLSSVLATVYFYIFIKQYSKTNALFLTAIFAVFPARWLIVRSIGSPEPLFIGCLIASMYYFQNKKYWLAGIWGALAQLTKSPAILLFVAYFIAILLPALKHAASTSTKNLFTRINFRAYPVLLIPLSLLGVFYIYHLTMNDFFAYFHSGDNIHLFFPPFQIFNYSQPWVGTFWLEEIIFIYLFGALGIAKLIRKKYYTLLAFVGVFFATTIFVSQRDLLRYSLPIVPFLFAAFANTLTKKDFKYIIAFLLIPIYMYSIAYISQNFMQIANWAPLL